MSDSFNNNEQEPMAYNQEDLQELMELAKFYGNVDIQNVPLHMRKEITLDMLSVSMRLTTLTRCNNREDFARYMEELIDEIKRIGEPEMTNAEQLFLRAYAQMLRVEDNED